MKPQPKEWPKWVSAIPVTGNWNTLHRHIAHDRIEHPPHGGIPYEVRILCDGPDRTAEIEAAGYKVIER